MRRYAPLLVLLSGIAGGLVAEELPVPFGIDEARSPRFDPTGEWIAFEVRGPDAGDLYRVRVDGSGLERLTSGSDDDRQPAWTPDGQALVFSRGDGGSEGDLWRLDLASGDLERLTFAPGREGWPDVSPDGSAVAYGREVGGRFEIARLDLETGRSSVVDPSAERSLWPRWSPDGSSIAYFSRRGTAGESDDVFVFDVEKGRSRRITDRPGHDFCPAWSPGGEQLVIAVSGPEEHRAIEVLDLGGRRLATVVSGWERATEPDWSPRGDRIVFAGRRAPAVPYRLQVVDVPVPGRDPAKPPPVDEP